MDDTAGRVTEQTAQQAMDYTREAASRVGERARRNPVPFVLLGLGAAWLVARRTSWGRGDSVRRDEREYGTEWTGSEQMYDDEQGGLLGQIRRNPVPAALTGIGLGWLAFAGARSRARDYGSGWNDESGEEPGERGLSRARGYVSGASSSMRQMARRRRSQFQHMVQDNPLLVGIGALILGLAFGMAVPETEAEKQWMGEARDTVLGRAREMARNAANQVQDAAGTIAGAAGEIAGRSQSS